MSSLQSSLISQFGYNAWANGSVLQACSSLAPEELERDLKGSHSTVLATLRHIFYAERVWLKRLHRFSLPALAEIGDQRLFCDPPPEPTLTELARNWPAVFNGLLDFARNQPEHQSSHKLVGPDFEIMYWKLALHIVNHSTLHRGQVISMLRQFGQRPPNVDIFSYYMATSSATTS